MERRRRLALALVTAAVVAGGALFGAVTERRNPPPAPKPQTSQGRQTPLSSAESALGKLAIKGRAAKTGYTRAQFDDGWADAGNCDMRNYILGRDMREVKVVSATDCTVVSGVLDDPYTGKTITFMRGPGTSAKVQIDHVVALSDAWQKGAQMLAAETRRQFANDPLNLLAVDGPANQQKSDRDAATWVPPNKTYRCRYVARQIAVKQKYTLWVSQGEHDAMESVLGSCPGQALPVVSGP